MEQSATHLPETPNGPENHEVAKSLDGVQSQGLMRFTPFHTPYEIPYQEAEETHNLNPAHLTLASRPKKMLFRSQKNAETNTSAGVARSEGRSISEGRLAQLARASR